MKSGRCAWNELGVFFLSRREGIFVKIRARYKRCIIFITLELFAAEYLQHNYLDVAVHYYLISLSSSNSWHISISDGIFIINLMKHRRRSPDHCFRTRGPMQRLQRLQPMHYTLIAPLLATCAPFGQFAEFTTPTPTPAPTPTPSNESLVNLFNSLLTFHRFFLLGKLPLSLNYCPFFSFVSIILQLYIF